MTRSILFLALFSVLTANATPLVDNSTNLNAGATALAGASASSSATGVGIGLGGSAVGIGGSAVGVGGNALGVGGVGLGGAGGQGGSVGDTSVSNNVEAADYGDLRVVPPAIAPSVGNNVICPMVAQGSKAASVFFFSGSGTHAPSIVPICVAWHLGQSAVVERMACAASPEYAKANPNCEAN